MKTYIITDKDIEVLKNKLITEDFIINNWVETLECFKDVKLPITGEITS